MSQDNCNIEVVDNQEIEVVESKTRTGKHLCLQERKEIEKGLECGASMRSIARMLGRNVSSISREIKRGTVTQRTKKKHTPIKKEHKDNHKQYKEVNYYSANAGHDNAQHKLGSKSGLSKLLQDSKLANFVSCKILKDKWSPLAIAGYIYNNRANFDTVVCFKTIYNAIDDCILPNVRNIDLLRKVSLKSKTKHVRKHKKAFGKSIELRPKVVDGNTMFGHWEGDTVVGKDHKSVSLTLVERKSGQGIIIQLKDKTADSVMAAFEMLKHHSHYPKIFKTITFDNGSEFARCIELEQDGIEIYYAHPYSAYERGRNENFNGMLRRYIPKGTDMSKYSQHDLNEICRKINTYPRKKHNFDNCQNIFERELKALLASTA